MTRGSHRLSSLFLAVTILASSVGIACGGHRYYRVYDPYYTDYHQWTPEERGYYHQWTEETHRDPDRDFRRLPPRDQKEYWTWRHNHGDHDHDHDRH